MKQSKPRRSTCLRSWLKPAQTSVPHRAGGTTTVTLQPPPRSWAPYAAVCPTALSTYFHTTSFTYLSCFGVAPRPPERKFNEYRDFVCYIRCHIPKYPQSACHTAGVEEILIERTNERNQSLFAFLLLPEGSGGCHLRDGQMLDR